MDTPHTSWQHQSLPSHYYPVVPEQRVEPSTNRPVDGAFVSIYHWFTRKFSRGRRPFDENAGNRRNGEKIPATLHLMQVSPPASSTTGSHHHHDEMTETASTSRSHASPVLKPAPDYAKMVGDVGSRSAEEPITGRLAKVKEFVHQVNELPWVATDRVTTDYYPGKSKRRPQVQQAPPQGHQSRPLHHTPRHVRSWYSERSVTLPYTSAHGENGLPPQPSSFAADYSVDPTRNGDVRMTYPTGYVPAAQAFIAEHPHRDVYTNAR